LFRFGNEAVVDSVFQAKGKGKLLAEPFIGKGIYNVFIVCGAI
jgi:hypothetical protein